MKNLKFLAVLALLFGSVVCAAPPDQSPYSFAHVRLLPQYPGPNTFSFTSGALNITMAAPAQLLAGPNNFNFNAGALYVNCVSGCGGGGAPTGNAGGNLGGTYPNPAVLGLQNAWRKMGIVIAGGPVDASVVQEPTVFAQSSPQVVTTQPTGANVLGMFYTHGYLSTSLVYTESLDNGATWFPSSISISGHAHSCAANIGGTQYILAANAAYGADGLDIYSFASGAATLVKANIVVSGGGPAWKASSVASCGFWHDLNGSYYLLYEGLASGGVWSVGLATCTAPGGSMSCTDYGSNPVIVSATSGGSISNPKSVRQIDATHYISWLHGTPSGVTGVLPTDVYFATATAPTGPWTVSTSSAFWRTLPIEGVNSASGQAADFDVLTVGNDCFAWYTAFPDGTSGDGGGAGYALANQPCESFTASTPQGVAEPSPANTGLSAYGLPLRGASSASLSTGNIANITSVTIGPGTWNITGSGQYLPGGSGATVNNFNICLSTSNSSCSTISGYSYPETQAGQEFGAIGIAMRAGYTPGVNMGIYTVTVVSSTTFYLNTYQEFSAGSLTAYCSITAQRIY